MIVISILSLLAALICALAGIVRAVRRKPTLPFLIAAGVLGQVCALCLGLGSGGMSALLLPVLLLWFYGAGILLAAGIRALFHKSAGWLAQIGLIVLGVSTAAFPFCAGMGLPTSLLLLGLLAGLVGIVCLLVMLVCRLAKRPWRKGKWVSPIALGLAVVLFVGFNAASAGARAKNAREGEIHAIANVQTELNFEVKDGDTPLEVNELVVDEDWGSTRVYDSAHLNRLIDVSGTSAGECRRRIEQNRNIPEKFKDYFTDFVNRIETKYPDADLSMLCHNLETLRVEELNDQAYLMKTASVDSLGVYFNNENAIYIPEGTVYVEGEFGFQVLIHEFCHAARICWLDGSSKNSAGFDSDLEDDLLGECMNSDFSCSLLSYDERDIAYQTPSNYLRIMLECMDNYTLSDYMNHSSAYFLHKLDETAGDTNYASVIWKLIALQHSEWREKDIDIPAQTYEPIYDYLCRLYYRRYVMADMTDEEARAVADELVDKAFYDSPEDYKTETQPFYDNLDVYRAQLRQDARQGA